MNRVILVGSLEKDPEMRQVDGRTVAILRITTSRTWVDKRSGQRKEECEWHDVEVWGRLGEACGRYLAKGRAVYVAGRLETVRLEEGGSWRASQHTKVVAEVVQFLSGPPHRGPNAEERLPGTAAARGSAPTPGTTGGADEPSRGGEPALMPPADADELEPIP